MKQKAKNDNYRRLAYIVSPILTAVIILVIYSMRNIYPFGSGTIIDIDLGDGGIPFCLHFYDVIRGGASFFYDWTTAAGFERFAFPALLTPSVWFLALFPRELVFDAFSYLLLIKLALCAFCASVFLKNTLKNLAFHWIVIFSLLYAFSGYNLQYYTNIDWLDTAALFPLIVLALLHILKGKSAVPFILIMTYHLIVSVYLSFFIYLFLIFIGGAYIYTFIEKEDRKTAVFRFGAASAAPLAISLPVSVFALSSIFATSRFSKIADISKLDGLTDFIAGIINRGVSLDRNKVFMLAGLEFTIVALCALWIRYKRDRKAPVFFTSAFMLLAAQIVFENVNLLWHGGSYVQFPFRNGFMLSFVMCWCGAYYCANHGAFYNRKPKYKVVRYIFPALAVISFYVTIPVVKLWSHIANGITVNQYNMTAAGKAAFGNFSAAFTVVLAAFFFFMTIGPRKIRTVFTASLMVLVICFNAYGFIGAHTGNNINRAKYSPASHSSIMEIAQSDDVMNRINCPDSSLSTNYAYLIKRPAISNWTHTLDIPIRQAFWDLGFGACYTRVLDAGATVFSKALMNIKNSAGAVGLDGELYKLLDTSREGYRYYANKYTLPLGLVFDGNIKDIKVQEDVFEYQNSIYSSLTRTGAPLFEKARITDTQYTENNSDTKTKTTELTVKIKEKSVLYFRLKVSDLVPTWSAFDGCDISVNGKPFAVTANVAGMTSRSYPQTYNNGILELGVYENEDVIIEIKDFGTTYENEIYTVKTESLESLRTLYGYENEYSAGERSFKITLSSDQKGDYMFLPITYSDSWKCTVNGKEEKIEQVLGDFMAVRLSAGENNVELKLSVRKNIIGYIAVLGLLISAVTACYIIERKKKEHLRLLQKSASAVFALLFSAAILFVYALPVVASLKILIKELLSNL